MARFNTALTSASITGTATIGSPNAGSFTNLTGTAPYTVTVPNPQLHPGVNQVFYNATSGTVTLTTPSGNFNGTGGNGTASISVFAGNVVSITSDGTHYIVISEDGSALTATTGSFSGNVTMNGSGATVSITPSTLTVAPTGASTIDAVAIGSTTRAAGAFTSLAANAAVTLTANTASSSTGTGTLVVTGGIGASGQVTASAISATNLTGTLQTAAQTNITSVGALTGLTIDGALSVGGLYNSPTQTLAITLGSETWVKLCTLTNRCAVKIQIGAGSGNSEEESEIEIIGTYVLAGTQINVKRQTYNEHLREVRVTQSAGGLPKIVYVRLRSNDLAPNINWRLFSSRGVTALHSTVETPSAGESLLVDQNNGYFTNAITKTTNTLYAGSISTTGALTSSASSPLSFTYNGNSGTYTQSVIYANQNNTSGNTANGIFIERGRLTDSGSGEIRSFVIGDRGGAIQLILNKDGKLGIGTTTPNAKLSVNTTTFTAAANTAQVAIENTDAWTLGLAFYIWGAGTYNSGYASGYVGSPNTSNRLFVSGGATVIDNPDGGGSWAKTLNSNEGSFISTGGNGVNFYTNAGLAANTAYSPTFRMRLDTSGNLGIGTSSPGRKLEISTTLSGNPTGTGNVGSALRLSNLTEYEANYSDGTGNPDFLGSIEFYSGDSSTGTGVRTAIKTSVDAYYNAQSLRFYTSPVNAVGLAERMCISYSGYVGIGTTSPDAKLSIIDENGGQSMLQVRNYSTAATGVFSNAYTAEIRGASSGTQMHGMLIHLNESGYTTDRRTLDVSDYNGIFASFTNGKVGIGTTNPAEKLNVSGNILVSGNVKNSQGGGIGSTSNFQAVATIGPTSTSGGVSTYDIYLPDYFSVTDAMDLEIYVHSNPNGGGSGSYRQTKHITAHCLTSWYGSGYTPFLEWDSVNDYYGMGFDAVLYHVPTNTEFVNQLNSTAGANQSWFWSSAGIKLRIKVSGFNATYPGSQSLGLIVGYRS